MLFIILTLTAQAQMRDSTYIEDSTASAVDVTIRLNPRQAAGLYRVFGTGWQTELKSHINHVVVSRDPLKEQREQWDELQNTPGLTAAQKRVIGEYLGIKNPRLVQVQKKIQVPVVER